MGVVTSLIAAATIPTTKYRNKRRAKKVSAAQSIAHASQPFEHTPSNAAEEGLRVENLVTHSPPAPIAAPIPSQQPTTSVPKNKMATDEDYMSFLTKANADPDEPTSSSAPKRIQKPTKQVFKAVDDGAVIPTRLKLVAKDAFYVSDADEPFEPVSLSFKSSTSLPDKITFAKLIRHSSPEEAEVEILDAGEWDAQGQYKDVVEAVRESVKGGDVRVYRVRTEGARAEYWVLGMEGGRMLGVRCLAIES